jgi:hypothetical protein
VDSLVVGFGIFAGCVILRQAICENYNKIKIKHDDTEFSLEKNREHKDIGNTHDE